MVEKEFFIKYEEIRTNDEINNYITQADLSLKAMGYTEHSFVHVTKCAKVVKQILTMLNYSKREINLGQIAAYIHDIGNVINRVSHAQSGALMAFRILDKLGMQSKDIASIVTAIGNHDESTAFPVNAITAALILADKTDVRRSRVRNSNKANFDIHDRVNYAVINSLVNINDQEKTITLDLTIDIKICPVVDYFEIFLNRMTLCRKAAETLGLQFKLIINGSTLI